MIGNLNLLCDMDYDYKRKVKFGENFKIDIEGIGNILLFSIDDSSNLLTNVSYTPNLKANFLSLNHFRHAGL